jgi:hypothetical protein
MDVGVDETGKQRCVTAVDHPPRRVGLGGGIIGRDLRADRGHPFTVHPHEPVQDGNLGNPIPHTRRPKDHPRHIPEP